MPFDNSDSGKWHEIEPIFPVLALRLVFRITPCALGSALLVMPLSHLPGREADTRRVLCRALLQLKREGLSCPASLGQRFLGNAVRFHRTGLEDSCLKVMNTLLLVILVLLLLGGGGFYLGGPAVGGGGIGLVLLIVLIVYLMGGFRGRA